jgi:GcrA cell cycle regulator
MPRLADDWSLAEDALLKRFAFTETAPQIAARLGRSVSAVKYRGHALEVAFVAHAANSNWTDDAVATLKRMWTDGDSATVIARALGEPFTRNAVIGKVGRLGLSVRLDPSMESRASRKSKKVKPPKPAKAPKVARAKKIGTAWAMNSDPAIERAACARFDVASIATVGATVDAIPLEKLSGSHCRWPLTDASGQHRFCGAPRTKSAAEGSGVRWYCDAHGFASIDKKFHRHRAAQILAHHYGKPVPPLSMIPRQYADDAEIDAFLASMQKVA